VIIEAGRQGKLFC